MSKLKQTKHVAHKFTGFDKVSLVGLLIQVSQMTSSTQRRCLITYFVNTSTLPLAHRQARPEWYKRFVILWKMVSSTFCLESLSWKGNFFQLRQQRQNSSSIPGKRISWNLLTWEVIFNQLNSSIANMDGNF